MLCSIEGLNNIKESEGTKKDTTMTLCPFFVYKALLQLYPDAKENLGFSVHINKY